MAENEKKTVKAAKAKSDKPSLWSRIASWFKSVKSEAKKVVWPNKQTVVKNTVVVIVALIVLCAVVTVLDVVFGGIRDLLAQLV